MGFFYKKVNRKWMALIAFICILVLWVVWYYSDYDLNMRDNKYPPTIFFAIYGFIWLSILSYLYPILVWLNGKSIFVKNVLSVYNKEGYSIYLYQIFPYLIATPIFHMFEKSVSMIVLLPGTFLVLLFLNYAVGVVANRFNLSRIIRN